MADDEESTIEIEENEALPLSGEENLEGSASQADQREVPEWLKDLTDDSDIDPLAFNKSTTENLDNAPAWLSDLTDDDSSNPSKTDSNELEQSLQEDQEQPELENDSEDLFELDLGEESFSDAEAEQTEEELETSASALEENENTWIPESNIGEIENHEKQLEQPPANPPENQAPAEQKEALAKPAASKAASLAKDLETARNALDRDKLSDALKRYKSLLRHRQILDEVIADLQAALRKYSKEPLLWQTLGDAYVNKDRLRDALECYTKAEGLL